MDARGGQNTSVLQDGEAAGGISSTTLAARREDRHAAFPPDAINWAKMPRTTCPGR